MKCEICGRQYVALGVHLRHKHQVSPEEYREDYGLLKTAPLVDEDLSFHLRASALRRLEDPEYLAEVTGRCKENAKSGKPAPEMSEEGRRRLAARNSQRNVAYLEDKAPQVQSVLSGDPTGSAVYQSLGMGAPALKRSAGLGLVQYNVAEAKKIRAQRAARTTRDKAMARVAKVMPLYDTTRSAAEMCRLAGISFKTYKNWLAAGLIPRHPNGRGRLV